ncbi:hypothetical protein GKE82_05935 [Conexibacter sp. W3-3-2]|uniref:hypothetical protein n=1 Tax=Conexibacter sp. W3-3-2 TaxID=2675227 RepID=UPI0012B71ECC|nr:hypothetical protein [Conexibacter sp. W3-3-2]MTD43856.1 hypothetical protein [Conexibacter sp. W3-3-2]
MSPVVAIPGMPGETIDSRVLPDVEWFMQAFKVKITDGYAATGHAPNGEHPLGLAVDIVPDARRGGTWEDVDRLAKLAKLHPDVFPFVGWNGTPGHGDPAHAGGNAHLHLSWNSPRRTGPDAALLVRKLRDSVGYGGGLNLPDLSDSALGAAVGLTAGPLGAAVGAGAAAAGVADDALGLAGDAAGAAGGAAASVARSIVGRIWDEIAGTVGKGALYVVLLVSGLALVAIGLTRATGATPTPSGA